MKKAFCILGLASLLAAGAVVPGFAASDNASQATTGTQTGSQQVTDAGNGERLDRNLQPSQPVVPCHRWPDGIETT